jgi:signal peptidase complex subunit 2
VTSSRKHSPLYDVTVTYYKAGQPNVPHTIKFSRPFMQWFNEAGHFVALPFQQMFATEVAVIGSLDPTRAIKLDSKALSDAPSGTEPLKTVENIHATGLSASEATPTSRKGTKSRRKV